MQRLRLIAATLGFSLLIAFLQQSAVPARAASLTQAPTGQAAWVEALEPPIALIHHYWLPNGDYSAGHRGIDYRVSLGQAIFAPTPARVWFVGKVVDRPVVSLRTSSGELIEFEPACSDLVAGALVAAGQPIARVCDASAGYAQHCQRMRCLHYSLRNAEGYLSPQLRLNQLAPTALLPRN
ncbi:MAG: hypothetical protein RLZZ164_652 [Actinomycetota bacterium]